VSDEATQIKKVQPHSRKYQEKKYKIENERFGETEHIGDFFFHMCIHNRNSDSD
jgi:hypothetical protein